jgi:hypothetical protein
MGFLSDLKEKTKPAEAPVSIDEGDHERFSHYVDKNKVMESAITGKL